MNAIDFDISTQAGGLDSIATHVKKTVDKACLKHATAYLLSKLVNTESKASLHWYELTAAMNTPEWHYVSPVVPIDSYRCKRGSEEFTKALDAMVVDLKTKLGHDQLGTGYTYAEISARELGQLCLHNTWIEAAVKGEFHWGCINGCIVVERSSFTDWYMIQLERMELARRAGVDRVMAKAKGEIDPTSSLPTELVSNLRKLRDIVAPR